LKSGSWSLLWAPPEQVQSDYSTGH
jgi:hypothetical protein